MCLPHDVRCREDLVLPREKLVLELKAKAKLDDKDHCQLIRYMEERNKHSDWGAHTRGMLINFGDHGIEVWYLCYKGLVVQRVDGCSRFAAVGSLRSASDRRSLCKCVAFATQSESGAVRLYCWK